MQASRPLRCLLVGVRGHGGEEVYSRLLAERPPEGVDVSATLDFHGSCERARGHPLPEILLNRMLRPFLRFDLGYRVLSVADDVDLVHVHSHPSVLRRLGRRPVVFSAGSSHYHYVRDYEGWSLEKIERRYARARVAYRSLGVLDALLHHDRITLAYTFSESARGVYLEHGVPPWKIRVLAPGFDIPAPQPRQGDAAVTFLFMGREPRRKGGDLVLAAFAQLREGVPSARLLYVTDEPPAVPGPGVETRPLVPRDQVGGIYARADVFVNPVRSEGFGFTNVEAQGHGLPVVSTRVGAIPEVVEDGRTGILIAPGDGAALLLAMRRLARDGALRVDMAAAARQRFVSRFSLPVFHAGLRALYDEARDRAGA
jgi:glycosyltransferase involved in cell wall biosynthesis